MTLNPKKKKKSLILLFKIHKLANLKIFWATKLRISNRRNSLNSSINNSIKHVYQRYNGRLSKKKKEKKKKIQLENHFSCFAVSIIIIIFLDLKLILCLFRCKIFTKVKYITCKIFARKYFHFTMFGSVHENTV